MAIHRDRSVALIVNRRRVPPLDAVPAAIVELICRIARAGILIAAEADRGCCRRAPAPQLGPIHLDIAVAVGGARRSAWLVHFDQAPETIGHRPALFARLVGNNHRVSRI